MRRQQEALHEYRAKGITCIPALSLRQPWAWAVVHGGKDVENRGRRTSIRGRFVIQAAKTCEDREYRIAAEWMVARGLVRSEAFPDLRPAHGALEKQWSEAPLLPSLEELPRGVLYGTADLVRVMPIEVESPPAWKMLGKFGYVLRDIEAIELREWDGYPGWFYVPEHSITKRQVKR